MLHAHTRNIISSVLASSVRLWRGTSGLKRPPSPQRPISLFDREACPESRLVREALSELNLDAVIYPCPLKGQRFMDELKHVSGDQTVPFLVDANTGFKAQGAKDILHYLFAEYRQAPVPNALLNTRINLSLSRMATIIRGKKGEYAKPSRAPAQPLVLYSFESSPFSRPVRELLCELELPYQLINLSKQQTMDMGPARCRFHLGQYHPIPGSKRATFLRTHGRVQVPCLHDPNTGQTVFESERILQFLFAHYAVEA